MEKDINEKTSILIVDDDEEIADLIEIHLSSMDYNIYKANNALDGLKIIEENNIMLALLDIMMPEMNGIEMCQRIRKERNIPIIFISAKANDIDKIQGLMSGADDYITKPFNPMEIIARVRSQLRRYTELNPNNPKDNKDVIQIKNIVIDSFSHTVRKDDEIIPLTRLEFDILKLLASQPGKVFDTEEIFEKVWKDKIFEGNNTVMVHIRRIREKLEENPKEPTLITTVWGCGYKIEG